MTSVKNQSLDYGVEQNENCMEITNPFFKSDISDIDTKELCSTFNNTIYILCLNDTIVSIDNMFYQNFFSKERFEQSKKEFVLILGSMKMLSNMNHKKSSSIVEYQFLENYNHNNYKLNEKEIVLCMPNISKSDIKLYVNLYTSSHTVDDYIKLKLLMNYFNDNINHNTLNKNMRYISYCNDESNYWTNKFHCKLNMTSAFIKRGFKLKNNSLYSKEINDAINKVDDIESSNENYLQDVYRKEVYIDASNAINRDGYKIYRIDKDSDLTIDEINEIFSNTENEREIYDIFNMLLTSKKNCHLVINNSYVLDKMKPIFAKFMPLYKYLIGYTWLIFYLEECIKKTRITVDDRFVYSIDVASKLPFFPYCSSDPHMNPYMSLLVSKQVLDYENNLQSLSMISEYANYGISDLVTFKKNFNIFTTGNKDKNILDGVNWSNIAVTGSSMTACIPKKHPLTEQFKYLESEEKQLNRYYQEYYPTSDIDVMCNDKNKTDFVDTVYNIYECVKKNIMSFKGLESDENINLVPYKTATAIVNTKYITENLLDYSVDYVIKNKNTSEIKEIFYCKYITQKIEQNNLERKTKSDLKYNSHYEIVSIDNFNIIFTDFPINEKKDDVKLQNMLTGEEKNNEDIYLKINENLKYKIESSLLLHNIEIFQIKYPEFFSCVARFHLPCVRAYYNNSNVYLLPSAITAYMTGINMDYKYFAGTKDPIEIINKNRIRGYTTCINDVEKIHTIEYSRNVEKWQNLMQITVNSKYKINSLFGPLKLDNRMFKPRYYNNNLYNNNQPVDGQYTSEYKKYVNSFQDLEDEYKLRYGYQKENLNLLKFKTINEKGYVNPLENWIMEAAYSYITG